MTDEKRKILDRVNELIEKRKKELLSLIPDIHVIEDGIIIRSFTDWDNCDENDAIRYKRIPNVNRPEEIVVLFYLPKGTMLEMKKRDYINFITCLSGSIELNVNNKTIFLESYKKISLEHNVFSGRTIENTYLITTNRL
jgi:hypothetical protein